MNVRTMEKVLRVLEAESRGWNVPIVTLVANTGKDPYRVLVSCLLSLRTKDETTAGAVKRLFAVADDPGAMMGLSVRRIERLIYPVGFYRNKARRIRELSDDILNRCGGRIPSTVEGLLRFRGVGRKTANLVVAEGFGKPAVCVDIHVHRITNRLGFVKTRDPNETETVLRSRLPRRWWRKINAILVAFGQCHCRPVSPFCSTCRVRKVCEKNGVERSR